MYNEEKQKYYGIIYKYTNKTNNKPYIGQTEDEDRRRREWKSQSNPYAGKKINNARKKYGINGFTYKVLCVVECDTEADLLNSLNEKEDYYIELYDSIKNGYNSVRGGRRIQKDLSKIISKLENYGGVVKFDLEGNYISSYSSIMVAARENEIQDYSGISKCCKNLRRTCGGYQWMTYNDYINPDIENRGKYRRGENNKNIKEINQYDLSGNLIATFKSATEASEKTGIDKRSIYLSMYSTWAGGGYIWKKKEDCSEDTTNIGDHINHNTVSVNKYDLSGKYLNTYSSIVEAATSNLGSNESSIYFCCKCADSSHSSGGFLWRYASDVEKGENIDPYIKYECSVRVSQFSLSGEFIRAFNSITEAVENTEASESGIIHCLRQGNVKYSGNSMWKVYEEGDETRIIPSYIKPVYSSRAVLKLDKNLDIVARYDSVKSACLSNNRSYSWLTVKGGALYEGTYSGKPVYKDNYWWIYEKDYDCE